MTSLPRQIREPSARYRAGAQPRPATDRAGTSLVEMLVVVSFAAVMLGLSATLIHFLLGAEREAQRVVRFNRSVTRLSEAFRADVHAAGRIELSAVEAGKSVLLLAGARGGREVRYAIDAHLATRVESEEGRQTHQDTFFFPPRSTIRFDQRPDQNLLRLEIEMPAGNSSDEPQTGANPPGHFLRRLTVEALPGRDYRFEKPKSP